MTTNNSPLYLPKGGLVGLPPAGEIAIFADANGNVFKIDEAGSVTAIGGGTISNSLVVLARAQSLLGTQYTSIGGTDFYQASDFTAVNSGSATATLSAAARSGMLKLSTGVTTTSTASIILATSASQIDNVKTSKFYAVWRAALVTAADALSSQAFTITGNSGSTLFQIGCRGPTGTGFFNVFAEDDGGNIRENGSTIFPVDTVFHTFEIWNDGTNINFAMDGAVLVSFATALLSGGAPAHIGANVANGATATNREVDIDYMFVVTTPN
jgi:hypothetical protein